MPHRRATGTVEVCLAADVGSDDDFRLATFQGIELVVAQLLGQLRLGQRVAACRAAAQVRVGHAGEFEAQALEHVFDRTAELLCMLQGAGAVEGHAHGTFGLQLLKVCTAQYFYQVLGQGADPFGLARIARIVAQQVAVILDEGTTAAGGLHDGFGTGFDGRPPGVDITPGAVEAGFLGVEVVIHRTTATGLAGRRYADAETVEHAGGSGVGVGRQAWLHAAFEHQHAARMALLRTCLGRADFTGQVGFQAVWHQRTQSVTGAQQSLEQRRARHHVTQTAAQQTLAQWARYLLIDEVAADIQQVVVLHAGRAGGFAVAAGQAAIQVGLGAAADFAAFEHLLHQIDAPTRAIQLITHQLIGGAGRIAEAAVHARAQNALGFFGAGQAFGLFAQVGLHGLHL